LYAIPRNVTPVLDRTFLNSYVPDPILEVSWCATIPDRYELVRPIVASMEPIDCAVLAICYRSWRIAIRMLRISDSCVSRFNTSNPTRSCVPPSAVVGLIWIDHIVPAANVRILTYVHVIGCAWPLCCVKMLVTAVDISFGIGHISSRRVVVI
jgi:hypothetical protein